MKLSEHYFEVSKVKLFSTDLYPEGPKYAFFYMLIYKTEGNSLDFIVYKNILAASLINSTENVHN